MNMHTLPTGSFVYVTSGQARLYVDGTSYEGRPHFVLHAGGAAKLSIVPKDELFACYVLTYQATFPDRQPVLLGELPEGRLSFEAQFACSSPETARLQPVVADMFRHWQHPGALDKLRLKPLFYQFVYELLRMQMEQEASGGQPDFGQRVQHYLREHYNRTTSVAELAQMFGCSVTHLSRTFKRQTGMSPIQYVIGLRMATARRWLSGSSASLNEIAEMIGYPDSFYFSRMFKKHHGQSPLQYRKKAAVASPVPDSPVIQAGCVMESGKIASYNNDDNDYYYHENERENNAMSFQFKPTAIVATLFVSAALMLGACQSTSNQQNAATGQPSNASQTAEPSATEQPTTRIYKHIDGESEIPIHPQRVFTDLKVGQLQALGVKPIGSSSYPLTTGFIDAEGIADLGVYPLNLEMLADLQPDLIILTEAWRDGGGYEAFNKIAPTIVIPNHAEELADELRMFGDILGKEEEAESWITNFVAKVAEAKKSVDAVIGPEETFTILNVREKEFMIYDDVNMGGNIIYQYLGLTPQEKVRSEVIDGETWEVSAEVIPDYVGDHLFIASAESAQEKLEDSRKIWSGTAAVQNDNVYHIDFNQFLLTDPISVSHQLQIITDLLLDKNQP